MCLAEIYLIFGLPVFQIATRYKTQNCYPGYFLPKFSESVFKNIVSCLVFVLEIPQHGLSSQAIAIFAEFKVMWFLYECLQGAHKIDL